MLQLANGASMTFLSKHDVVLALAGSKCVSMCSAAPTSNDSRIKDEERRGSSAKQSETPESRNWWCHFGIRLLSAAKSFLRLF